MPVVKQSVRKGETTAPVIGEKMVRAGAEPWARLQKGPAGWTHLVSTGLCGWCPSYHKTEPDQKLLQKGFPRVLSVSRKFTGLHVQSL